MGSLLIVEHLVQSWAVACGEGFVRIFQKVPKLYRVGVVVVDLGSLTLI